jgi:hypothetical protein
MTGASGRAPPGIKRGAAGLAENTTGASTNARELNQSRCCLKRRRETTRPRPAQVTQRRLRLVEFRPLVKGALGGFAPVVLHAAILRWRERDLANRFSDTLIELVRAARPAAFEREGAP